ncbi:MAG: glucokinase [Nitrospinales bacterium]|jgi:glucokinase|nr:glucokinase [Nitrospinales bacterium]
MQPGGKHLLVIDLGGTNIRAAYAALDEDEIFNIKKIKISHIDEFYQILGQLISGANGELESIVISVAGPKNGETITMSNRDWKICVKEIKEKFEIKNCYLLNDWEAIAYSLSSLKEKDLRVLKKGSGLYEAPKFVIGPGTGLGAALYSKINDIEYVNPTELGNTQTSVQHYLDIFEIGFSEKFTILEDVFSGPGISRVAHELIGENLSGEEILQRAQADDIQCISLIEKYIKCFAVLSSEVALSYNCHGGIFIAGSFMRGLEKYFDLDSFTNDFIGTRKQIHQDFLGNIPVFLVKREFTPLYGNLNYYQSKKRGLVR